MTKKYFLDNYYCKFQTHNLGNVTLIVTTDVFRSSDNRRIDGIKSIIDIQETDTAVYDSNSMGSLNAISWGNVIDFTKRGQLDYVAQKARIDNFYPLNSIENPYISMFYWKFRCN